MISGFPILFKKESLPVLNFILLFFLNMWGFFCLFAFLRERRGERKREKHQSKRKTSISCLAYAHHNLSVHETLNQWSYTGQGFPTIFIVMYFSLCSRSNSGNTGTLRKETHLGFCTQVFSSASVHSSLYNFLFPNNFLLKGRQPCHITSLGLFTSRPCQQIKLELIRASQGQDLGKDKMPQREGGRKQTHTLSRTKEINWESPVHQTWW